MVLTCVTSIVGAALAISRTSRAGAVAAGAEQGRDSRRRRRDQRQDAAIDQGKEEIARTAGMVTERAAHQLKIRDIERLSESIDLAWAYLRDRALAEVAVKGLVDSTGKVTGSARAWYVRMIPELVEWYRLTEGYRRCSYLWVATSESAKKFIAGNVPPRCFRWLVLSWPWSGKKNRPIA